MQDVPSPLMQLAHDTKRPSLLPTQRPDLPLLQPPPMPYLTCLFLHLLLLLHLLLRVHSGTSPRRLISVPPSRRLALERARPISEHA